jgi:transposase
MMVAKKVIDDGMSYREAAKTFGLSHGSISNISFQGAFFTRPN